MFYLLCWYSPGFHRGKWRQTALSNWSIGCYIDIVSANGYKGIRSDRTCTRLSLSQCCAFAIEICLAELMFCPYWLNECFLLPDCVMATLMFHFQISKCSMHATLVHQFLNGYEHYYWMSNIAFSAAAQLTWLRMQSDDALFELRMQVPPDTFNLICLLFFSVKMSPVYVQARAYRMKGRVLWLTLLLSLLYFSLLPCIKKIH